MTADTTETESDEKDPMTEPVSMNLHALPAEIEAIFDFLSGNNKIVFKSQQIDDPELQRSEKIQVAREIYAKNRQTFLMRFGSYLEEQHLSAFARLAISSESNAAPLRENEHCEEMQYMLVNYRNKLHTRKRDVKNRRYAAMQRLIKQGEYFSEKEMMRRAPELYQELVGQYLSSAEKKQRDGYDVKNTTFSGILMHTMEQREMDEMLKQADKHNKNQARVEPIGRTEIEEFESDESNDEVRNTSPQPQLVGHVDEDVNGDDVVPASFRQQWGNFDNEQQACSTSRATSAPLLHLKSPLKVRNVKQRQGQVEEFITAGERNLLRQEFIGIMHGRFLAGNDDDFDYSQVDDDSQLDDLLQLNQDKEDAYFGASDIEDDASEELSREHGVHEQLISRMDEQSNESEDDLDIYMSHLSKHHSLQN